MPISRQIRSNTWLVTGRHRVVVGTWPDDVWRPHGSHHARRVGDSRTLCGLVAIEWPMFWDMRFDMSDARSCGRCAQLMGAAPAARV